MLITRRRFLQIAAATLGITSVMGIERLMLTNSQLQEQDGLDDHVLETLMMLVGAYVGSYGSTSHYRSYFVWRADNLAGYRNIYQAFVIALDAVAYHLVRQNFIHAEPAVQQIILQDALELPLPESGLMSPEYPASALGQFPVVIEEQLWEVFHRSVLAEIVHVFMNTNAWVMLGYEAWPSIPRGLEQYTQPVGWVAGVQDDR